MYFFDTVCRRLSSNNLITWTHALSPKSMYARFIYQRTLDITQIIHHINRQIRRVGDKLSRYIILVFWANWAATHGRFGAQFPASTTGRYNAAPSKGNIGNILRIFCYLKHQMKIRIICDTRFLRDQGEGDIDLDWLDLYPDGVY